MKARSLAVFMILFTLLMSTACTGSADQQGNEGTGARTTGRNNPCYHTLTSNPGPKDTYPEDQTAESAGGTITGNVRPYQDFLQGLLRLQPVLNEVFDIDGNTVLDRSKEENAVTDYLHDELY